MNVIIYEVKDKRRYRKIGVRRYDSISMWIYENANI
jgi:hypothetical protein